MAQIAQTTDFRVRKGLVVENTATIMSTVGTVGTNSGALQVTGGVGIGGGLFVGGTVTATNFSSNGSGGSLTGANLISTIAFTATTATITSLYVGGGSAGSIPIQNAAGAMAFIPQGTTGYVLTAAAGNTATWSALSGLSAGTATNAINILTQAQTLSGAYYPTFVNANNNIAAYSSEYTTSSFSINPATGALTNNGALVLTTATLSTYGITTVTAGTDTAVSITSGNATIWGTSTLQSVTSRGGATTVQLTLNNGIVLGSTSQNPILMNSSYTAQTPAFIVANGTLVGTTTTTQIYAFNYQHNLAPVTTATITSYYGQLFLPTLSNTANYNSMYGAFSRIDMAAAATTGSVGTWIGFTSETPTRNAASDVRFTNHFGFRAQDPSSITATNVYGYASQIAVVSGLNKWNIYSSGTAPNYFSGQVGIGSATLSSGALTVTGGATITGVSTLTNTVNATSTNSGALQVVGGVGIGGGLYVGGDINISNGQLIINGRETNDGSLKSQVQISSTGTYTNAPVSGIEFSAQYAPGAGAGLGGISVGKLNTTSGDYSSYLSLHTRVNGSGVAERFRIDSTGSVIVFATVPSNSTNTGALQIAGGAGIGGGLFVGGIVTATTANITGNETVGGSLSVTGNITATIVTATTFVGALTGNVTGTASSTNNLTGGAAGSIPIQSAAGTTAYIPIGSGGQILTVSGSTASWTSLSGLSAGNATTATNLALGTAGQIPYQANPGSTGFFGPGTAGQLLLSNGTSAPGYSSSIPSLIVSNSTTVTNTITGAFQVVGGVGIGGGLYVGGTVQVAGATTFGGPVTFSGPATYILSTNTYWTDNILELHTTSTGVTGQWTGPDGKDIGFRFHYYNRTLSTDSNAALVLADDSQVLEWYGTGAETNTGTFSSATYGTFKTGAIQLRSGVGTTNATSGDLQVAGGVGIGGGLFVGGVLTATIHSSPSSLTFNVNNNSTAILVDANRNILLGGASSVLNSVNVGSVVQLGDAGSALSGSPNPYIFFNGKYSTAAGVPQYGGIWASSNYWGIGPDTNSLDSTVRIGTMTAGATGYQWAAGYANLKVATVTAQGLQVNGVVTATTFYGTFIGTLTTIASTANTVVSQITNANALYYPTFVGVLNTSTNIGQVEYTTSSFTVNPSTGQVNIGSTSTATVNALLGVNGNAYVTGILTATNVFVGPWQVNTSTFSGNAGLANTATSVIVQAASTGSNYYPSFVDTNNVNTNTAELLYTSSSFYINASTGNVTLGSTTVTNNEVILGLTNATTTATGALQVKGGVGVGGSMYVGGDIYTNGSTKVIPLNIQEFTATGGQTTFTPTGGYAVGTAQVFANGINLGSGDFTASNGTTVVLNAPRISNDIIRIISGGVSSSVNNIQSFSIAMSVAMAM